MATKTSNPEPVILERPRTEEALERDKEIRRNRDRGWALVRLLWDERNFVFRAVLLGLVIGILLAFLIPKRYESITQLMPPDSQSANGLALMAGLSAQGGGVGALAGDLLGIRNTGALFIGVLTSRTVQDRIIDRFELKKVYGVKLEQTARQRLAENSGISEDRKSGIISLHVTDHDPKRAAAMAGAYVGELDAMMTQLNTSAAHRERVFLEERLSAVNLQLENAETEFSQFASKNGTIDISTQGKAVVEAGATLEGQMIAVQSQLEGLKQIYTENNVRVRAMQARVTELRHQLEFLGGKPGVPPGNNEAGSAALHPSLRQLPILGVTYADLFRKWKVEEGVYETLTKEYELAKVEEAKETPTVKVLDAPDTPEKQIYPPRFLIVVLGTFLFFSLAALWILADALWREMDPEDSGKMLMEEIVHSTKAQLMRGFQTRPFLVGLVPGLAAHRRALGEESENGSGR